MRALGVVVTALAAMLLLSGCVPSMTQADASHSANSFPSPTPTLSTPAFLLSAQLDTDRLPDGIADRMKVDAASSRYQGAWDERQIFVAISDDDSVCLVTQYQEEPDGWRSACGASSGVVTVQFPDGGTVKYVPLSTTATPQGWTRLSDYIFAM